MILNYITLLKSNMSIPWWLDQHRNKQVPNWVQSVSSEPQTQTGNASYMIRTRFFYPSVHLVMRL